MVLCLFLSKCLFLPKCLFLSKCLFLPKCLFLLVLLFLYWFTWTQNYRCILFHFRQRMERIRESLTSSEHRLTQLYSNHKNQLATFGPNMRTLVTAIQQDSHRFSCAPIGPLGSKIKLKDYSWSTAIEQVIKKSLLNAFIVNNHKDEDVLRKMINSIYRNGSKPEIICSRYQNTVYDVSKNVSSSMP